MIRSHLRRLRSACLALSALVIGCKGDGPSARPPAASITITTPASTLATIGATLQLSATALNTTSPPRWSSGSPGVASVSATGLASAVANGTTVITASVPGASATVTITVNAGQAGSLDPSLNPGAGGNELVMATAIQGDGKIIIVGLFTSYNGTSRSRIARLNADGTLDGTFNPGTGANGEVEHTAIQDDGKILIAGSFTSYNGTAINRIARLNADGSLDMTFNPGTGAIGHVTEANIQSDGKIIIVGYFNSYNGTARGFIARLNADGTLDGTFNPGTGANGFVQSTAMQSDGRIVIGGGFTSYNGTARNFIARLNIDGTLDLTFNPGTGANVLVRSTAIQSDGKIIVGGDFTSYNGTARNFIARLNADGTLDGTFNPGTGANDAIATTAIQGDGKIIIVGLFTSYNGTSRNRIARLNADGTLDGTFNPGTGADNYVRALAIQSDEHIVIGGRFTSYGGIGRTRIARIFGR